jgi:hypothetical protein
VGSRPIFLFSTAPARFLAMAFDPNLTDAGGTSSIFLSPGNSAEFTFDPSSGEREFTAGTATGVALATVPEPATLAGGILGVALMGGAWLRRRAA